MHLPICQKNTLSLTTSMMLSLSVLVVPVFVLPSVLLRLVSTLLVFPSFSLLVPTQLLLRVVSTLLSEICTRITGNGTCTTPLRVLTGLVIRMLSTT